MTVTRISTHLAEELGLFFATIVMCALLGLVAGLFLPRLIDRFSENVRVEAGTRRRLLMGVLTAFVLSGLGWRLGPHVDLLAFCYLGVVGVALAGIDINIKRLPDPLTLASYPVGGALLGVAALARGDGGPYLRALISMAALFGLYFALALINPDGMGFGDVKLAGVLGLYLGWLGWNALIVGTFLAFLLGAVVSVALLVAHRVTRKSHIPFGPFMLLGAFLAILWR